MNFDIRVGDSVRYRLHPEHPIGYVEFDGKVGVVRGVLDAPYPFQVRFIDGQTVLCSKDELELVGGLLPEVSTDSNEYWQDDPAYAQVEDTTFDGGPVADTTNPKDALGIKKAALRLVPNALTIEAIPAMALGAAKYGEKNWRQTDVRMSVYIEAARRHLAALEDGMDYDDDPAWEKYGIEPGTHLGSAIACLGILADAKALGTLIDDRVPGPAPHMLANLDRSRG